MRKEYKLIFQSKEGFRDLSKPEQFNYITCSIERIVIKNYSLTDEFAILESLTIFNENTNRANLLGSLSPIVSHLQTVYSL